MLLLIVVLVQRTPMICLIGLPLSWVQLRHHMRMESLILRSSFLLIIPLSHQRSDSPPKSIIVTSTLVEEYALIYLKTIGVLLLLLVRCCYLSAHCSVIPIQMILLCLRLPSYTRQAENNTMPMRWSGPGNTHRRERRDEEPYHTQQQTANHTSSICLSVLMSVFGSVIVQSIHTCHHLLLTTSITHTHTHSHSFNNIHTAAS